MPRIELISVPLYAPMDPYFWEVDNIPLKSLMDRQNLINMALDNVITEITNAIGTQGSMANRLNQSINADGSLKSEAIDEVNHSIESHEDTEYYVRMTAAQSAKIDLIDDQATSIYFKINPGDDEIEFLHGAVQLVPSNTVTFSVDVDQQLSFETAFPVEAAHQHFYEATPVPTDLVTPDYINYLVDPYGTAFIEGSLRVYVNGVRINQTTAVYVPGYLISDSWTLLSYTATPTSGSFVLSAAISEDDVVVIDYDISLES